MRRLPEQHSERRDRGRELEVGRHRRERRVAALEHAFEELAVAFVRLFVTQLHGQHLARI